MALRCWEWPCVAAALTARVARSEQRRDAQVARKRLHHKQGDPSVRGERAQHKRRSTSATRSMRKATNSLAPQGFLPFDQVF
eukprot:6197699-Pleurochrysis_carterae.AAC.2